MAKSKKLFVLTNGDESVGYLNSDAVYHSVAEAEKSIRDDFNEDDEFVIYELVPVKRGKLVLETKIEWEKSV